MARESGSRGMVPAVAVGIGTGRMDGRDPADDLLGTCAATIWPQPHLNHQSHPNHPYHATEA